MKAVVAIAAIIGLCGCGEQRYNSWMLREDVVANANEKIIRYNMMTIREQRERIRALEYQIEFLKNGPGVSKPFTYRKQLGVSK